MKAKNEANRYDKIFKENLEAVTMGLVSKVLGIQVAHTEKLQTDLPKTLERKPDQLLKITDIQGNTSILHLEFQVVDEAQMIGRMLEYRAILRRKHNLPVQQYLIFLSDQQPEMETRIEEENLLFRFHLVCIAQVDYNVFLLSNNPDEIVFAVLGNFGSDDLFHVAQKLVHRLTEVSSNRLELDKHLEQLRILANLRKLKPFLEQIMEAITKYIKPEDDFLYQKGEQLGLEKGKQLGFQEGKQEGVDEEKQKVVKRLLLKKSFTEEQIAEIADVSVEVITKIRKELPG